MLFEIIDQKQKCKNIVLNNKIVSQPVYKDLSKTWSYHSSLKNYDIEYASLYSQGKTLDECCPENLKDKWNIIKQKHLAYIKSFETGFCELYDHCFYDLVPESFVIEYFSIKNKITEHVLKTYDKPENYDFLVEASELINDIKERRLVINREKLTNRLHRTQARSFYTKIFSCNSYITLFSLPPIFCLWTIFEMRIGLIGDLNKKAS